MSGRKVRVRHDHCVQCGESEAAIKASQSKGGQDQLYCATVDYFGECEAEWDRHRFTTWENAA